MARILGAAERVHQPLRDSLIRTSGFLQGGVEERTDLFQRTGGTDAERNVKTGSVLPSNQSMVILAARCLLWFRASVQRSEEAFVSPEINGVNGDYWITPANAAAAAAIMNGSVPGDYHDVYRLYFQASEQLLWTLGAGEKPSLRSMPSSYFPWGGGLSGDVGGATDLIHFNNGTPDNSGILRLGRSITLVPQQQILCQANINALPTGNNAGTFGATQGARVMANLVDNLNAADLVNKCIAFVVDGLFSKDVQ